MLPFGCPVATLVRGSLRVLPLFGYVLGAHAPIGSVETTGLPSLLSLLTSPMAGARDTSVLTTLRWERRTSLAYPPTIGVDVRRPRIPEPFAHVRS